VLLLDTLILVSASPLQAVVCIHPVSILSFLFVRKADGLRNSETPIIVETFQLFEGGPNPLKTLFVGIHRLKTVTGASIDVHDEECRDSVS